MKDTAEALAEFLNDFIGHVVPGAVLLTALFLLFNWPVQVADEVVASFSFLLIVIALAYGAGHAMSALHGVLLPALVKLKMAVNEVYWEDSLENSGLAKQAREVIGSHPSSKGRRLRSELMTLSPQAKQLAVRFQHVALLYTGVAMALWCAAGSRLYAFLFSSPLLRVTPSIWDFTAQSAVMFALGIATLLKGKEFHARSLRAPFSAGIAEIAERKKSSP